eukprot:7196027-Prymnesium_polylepis.2
MDAEADAPWAAARAPRRKTQDQLVGRRVLASLRSVRAFSELPRAQCRQWGAVTSVYTLPLIAVSSGHGCLLCALRSATCLCRAGAVQRSCKLRSETRVDVTAVRVRSGMERQTSSPESHHPDFYVPHRNSSREGRKEKINGGRK